MLAKSHPVGREASNHLHIAAPRNMAIAAAYFRGFAVGQLASNGAMMAAMFEMRLAWLALCVMIRLSHMTKLGEC